VGVRIAISGHLWIHSVRGSITADCPDDVVLDISRCEVGEVRSHDDAQLVRITGDAVQLRSSDVSADTDCHNSRHVHAF